MCGSTFEVETVGSYQVQQLVTLWLRETEREREIGRERELERERESSGLKD